MFRFIEKRCFVLLFCIQVVASGFFGYLIMGNSAKTTGGYPISLTQNRDDKIAFLLDEIQSLNKHLHAMAPVPVTVNSEDITEFRGLVADVLQDELEVFRDEIVAKCNSSLEIRAEGALTSESLIDSSTERIDPKERDRIVEDASYLVEDAIANGEWTERDSRHMIEFAPFLSSPERLALVETLGNAINNQQLAIDGPLMF